MNRPMAALLFGLMPLFATPAGAVPMALYIATDGNDAWSGTVAEPNSDRTDGPVASLERARDIVRELRRGDDLPEGGIDVILAAGTYPRAKPLVLTAADSGTARAPIRYRAAEPGTARLVGGALVTGFQPITDPAVRERLDPEVQQRVFQANLRRQQIDDFGSPHGGGLELFFNGRPMTLARWPNQEFVHIVDVLGPTPVDIRGTRGCVEGIFTYAGDRPHRWRHEADPGLHGYWFWDWSDARHAVESIDTETRTIRLKPPYHSYGYRKGQWYYAYNILAELDQPGEWYLDRDRGILYFWPPEPIASGQALVSILPHLIEMHEVAHVTFRGLVLEAVRDTAVVVRGGSHNRIAGCTIRNGSANAVRMTGAHGGVAGCDIYQMGEGGIALSGGDRITLEPAGLYAENNHIHHYGRIKPMYSAGISVHGVGNRVARNRIHSAPHQAIGFSGNDHAIEYNEIFNVCFESNDAGAIYSGRNWTMRGTTIRYNYLHHIYGYEKRGCVGVYLDDMYCGTEIYGNIFYQVPRAAFIGGGRDCTIANNIFVDCRPAVHVDSRALGWAHDHSDAWIQEGRAKGTLSGIRYGDPPYSTRYPKLPSILDDNPAAPAGNVIARNICWGGRWDEIDAKARPFVQFDNNLIDTDPRFVDPENLDFRLQPDSPAWQLGFQPIPIDGIGLQPGPDRASWPVQ